VRDVVGEKMVYPPGQILVCKVFIQNPVNDPANPYFQPDKSPSEIYEKEPVRFEGEESAVYRVHLNQPRDRLYFMRDSNLILPEYLVEFDYVMNAPGDELIFDCGEEIAVLPPQEGQGKEFIVGLNRQLYQADLPRIYNRIVEDVNSYKFEYSDEVSQPNLGIKA
jgi:hypothetical protein